MPKISLLLFLMISLSVFSQEEFILIENPNEVSKKIEQHSASVFSIKSDFTQQKHLSILEETLESTGNFIFKKTDNVKWQYATPFDYTIIVANGKFIIDNEGSTSEFDLNSNEIFKQINKMIVTAISGNFIGNNDFSVVFKENEKYYLAQLSPVEETVAEMLESINIYFSKESLSVEKVKFVEPGSDYTLIVFENQKENAKIDDSEFSVE